MIYNIVDDKRRHANDELINIFKCQIDNSLYYGWKPEDIIIGTNFDFEYKGIKSYNLVDICTYNIFNNKWYGMYELMRNGIIDDDFWFHDQDNWQINDLDFPKFNGEVAACTYIKTPEWNTGSVFVKKSGIDILRYIVESMKMNPLDYFGDEHWIAFLRHNSEVASYLSTVNTEYCVGYTYVNDRYEAANKPIKVIGFMPNSKSYDTFIKMNLIPNHLLDIFKQTLY